MTKKFKKVALVMIFATAPGAMMAMHRNVEPPKIVERKNTDRENSKPISSVEKQQAELTAAQKFAIQTRNALARTGVANQGWIDSMASTKEFKTSDGTRHSQPTESFYLEAKPTNSSSFIEGPSKYNELGIEMVEMGEQPHPTVSKTSIALTSALPSDSALTSALPSDSALNQLMDRKYTLERQLEIATNQQRKDQAQKLIDRNNKEIAENQSKNTNNSEQLNNPLAIQNITRPRETKMLGTDSGNLQNTPYRDFLKLTSYQEIRANMISPNKEQGYSTRIQAVNDYVNKLLIDMGTPDSFFLSARYMSRPFKQMVKDFSDAMNKATRSKNSQEQAAIENDLLNEVANFTNTDIYNPMHQDLFSANGEVQLIDNNQSETAPKNNSAFTNNEPLPLLRPSNQSKIFFPEKTMDQYRSLANKAIEQTQIDALAKSMSPSPTSVTNFRETKQTKNSERPTSTNEFNLPNQSELNNYGFIE